MKSIIFLLIVFGVAFFSLRLCSSARGCGQSEELKHWGEKNGKLKVLCTTSMIADLVKQIGGEKIDTLTLISGQLDPHSYQLVKGDDEHLLTATIIFFNGLGLEHGASLAHHLQDNPKAIALGDHIHKAAPEMILDLGGQPDPHIWMDISLWAMTIDPIVATLSKQAPEHRDEFMRRGEDLRKVMVQKHEEVRKRLQSIPDEKRYLVTSHDAFTYFARAYLAASGEVTSEQWEPRFAAPEGLAPDSQLSTTDIQKIINHLAHYHIQVLFPESNVSRDSIRKIVSAGQEKGLTLTIAKEALYGDAMDCPGSEGDTYLKMIEHNAVVIESYLK